MPARPAKRQNPMPLSDAQEALRDGFLAWQCRVRQLAVRETLGRPSAAMRPRILDARGEEIAPAITVLLHKEPIDETVKLFAFQAKKTQDPIERYEKILEHLAGNYYQNARDFDDRLTALFGPGSALADRLIKLKSCLLSFEEYAQGYRLPCRVRELEAAHPTYQASYWHNFLFNPNLPAGVRVLSFQPDWRRAEAYRFERD